MNTVDEPAEEAETLLKEKPKKPKKRRKTPGITPTARTLMKKPLVSSQKKKLCLDSEEECKYIYV